MDHPGTAPAKNTASLRDIWFNLALIGIAAALLALGLAYAIDALGRGNSQTRSAGIFVEKTVSGQKLTIPSQWLRYPGQERSSFAERLDLQLPLVFKGAKSFIGIHATLLRPGRAQPSAKLLDSVYLHNFASATVTGPVGLVGKPLKPVDGFQNETVWYDPISIDPFVAKCMAPVIKDGPTRCLRTVALNGKLLLTLDFDAKLLVHWRDFDAALGAPLERLGTALAQREKP